MDVMTVVVVLALAALSGLRGAPWSRNRVLKGSGSAAESVGSNRSPVRVLRGDDELHEATERALRYDRVAEETLHRRINRYTQSGTAGTTTVIDLPARRSDAARAGAHTDATGEPLGMPQISSTVTEVRSLGKGLIDVQDQH